jgi:hypothetical protein
LECAVLPRHEDFKKIYQNFIDQYGEGEGEKKYFAWLNEHGYDDTKPIPKKEGFSWAGSIKDMPGVDNLIRGQALHPLRTVHPDVWPEVREYLEEELEKSTHTLVGVPLILDHCQVLQGKVLGANYEDGAIEYVAQLDDPNVLELVRNGAIKHCSVEFEWKSLDQVNGVAPRGINFTGLSLLRLFQPGDPKTTVEVWEGIIKSLKEAKIPAKAAVQPRGREKGVAKSGKEKDLQTLEARVTFLETSKLLKEQEISKEEIETKLEELTKKRQDLENELQQIAEEEQPRRNEIWQQIDLVTAEMKAYEEALAALIAGTPASPHNGSAEEGKTKEAEWDTEYINDLPDSAFAYIEPGGEKDEQGKTVPRSLRHLPFRNAEGNIDRDHLVNALARLPQTANDVAKTAAKKKLCAAVEAWNSEHEDKIESDVCGIAGEGTNNQDNGEPEKDEHGCVIGKERYDEEQGKCVPIESATEQQGNQKLPDAGEPKSPRQRFMDHFGIDEEVFQKFYDLLGDELFKLLPEHGTKHQHQAMEKKKILGEAIMTPSESPPNSKDLISKKEVLGLIPHDQAWRSWSYGPQMLVKQLKHRLEGE